MNWKRAWQGVQNIFKGIFNGLVGIAKIPINAIIGLLNGAISGLNVLIAGANWIPGVDISPIGKIPYLARGGLIDKPTLAMVGEDGSEAVVPLKNNTEWTGVVANLISSRMGDSSTKLQEAPRGNDRPLEVVLQVGTTKLGRVVVDSINKLQDQEGRILLNI